ncbi:MAG TPA: 2,3-bisphosphoglycerate-independent phosphoglycerate mutase [Dongiaceae bacterium]|jgi:2,3-bisphosphoglycerate-independent phosphoglycerate mutase|nr:2,3-bisphosphoglycerate-independent phosphoglycerate mutase [Dongiaceae bacterium]
MKRPKPVVLCILDGWGHRPETEENAIAQARKPNWDAFLARYPHCEIDASELHVGLPQGQMGNSEVGHMNIGAGRVVMQDLPRIDAAIADGSLCVSPLLTHALNRLKQSGGTCHLMGLVSPGGVHAHQDHIVALAHYVTAAGVPLALHGFLDGRDTPPQSARTYLEYVDGQLPAGARWSTLSGRYYAMDRDQRWERITKAYDAIAAAAAPHYPDIFTALADSYSKGITDEFFIPAIIGAYAGMEDGDGVIMANFRADRAREILTALLDPDFASFSRKKFIRTEANLGMVEYSEALARFMPALFPPAALKNTLGEVVAAAGLRQLRVAETEKYAHVTFFFNGGEEKLFPGEERILVPSPKVATYDLKPEMSAFEVTDRMLAAIRAEKFDVIIVNFANTDMVGHTGNLAAAIKAVEAVDTCVGRIAAEVEARGGLMLVTSDHGNAEMMYDEATRDRHTAHTLNLVPLVLVNAPAGTVLAPGGKLADIAPTLLTLLGLPIPREMTGRSLLV